MTRVWAWTKAFGGFWWGFIVGDDWTVAAAVTLALLATWGLVAAGAPAWWLLPLVVVASVGASIWRLERASGQGPQAQAKADA